MSPCTIFVPLFNEEDIVLQNTERLLRYMEESELPCEIILGSNGSQDATPEIIHQLAREKPNVRAFHLPQRGPGEAFVLGTEMASHEFIVSQDIDLSVELEFIPLALEFLQRSEVVIGCKRMNFQKRPYIRRFGSNFFIFVAAMLLGVAAADFSIGAKGYRTAFVLEYANKLDKRTAYVLELVFYAIQNGRRVVEVPVACEDRRPSRFNLLSEALYRFNHLFRFAWLHRTSING